MQVRWLADVAGEFQSLPSDDSRAVLNWRTKSPSDELVQRLQVILDEIPSCGGGKIQSTGLLMRR